MRIERTLKGWVISKGIMRRQFFALFVDHDRASWTKSSFCRSNFSTRKAAEEALKELKRRGNL